MSKMLDEFTGLYKLSKTLRFELRPVGKTLKNLDDSKILTKDKERAESYPEVKKLLDEQHKMLLERSLSHCAQVLAVSSEEDTKAFAKCLNAGASDFDWGVLKAAFEARKADGGVKEWSRVTFQFRSGIVMVFKKDEQYDPLVDGPTPEKYFKQLGRNAKEQGKELDANLKRFARFSTYFTGYQENRKNIYAVEEQATAAAYRAINENFPRFLAMLEVFAVVESKYPAILEEAESELTDLLKGRSLKDCFKLEHYSDYLPQSGIDFLNQLIGGYTQNGGRKYRGLNECINLFRQKSEEARLDRKLSSLPLLYKQILSDRDSLSFSLEMFKKDDDLLGAVKAFLERLDATEINGETISVISGFRKLLSSLSCDPDIYVMQSELSGISCRLCGSWSGLEGAMNEYAEAQFKTKKLREEYLKRKQFSLKELSALSLKRPVPDSNDSWENVEPVDAWKGEKIQNLFDGIEELRVQVDALVDSFEGKKLREDAEAKGILKEYLDKLLELLHVVRPFDIPADTGLALNRDFYDVFEILFRELDSVIPLYNRTRNYLTQRVGAEEKMKLNFDCPTLANGWDQNKENEDNAVIFENKGLYYLGIIRKGEKINFEDLEVTSGVFHKLVYKQFEASKGIPKCSLKRNDVKAHFKKSSEDFMLQNEKFALPLRISKELFDLYFPAGDAPKKFKAEYLKTTQDESGYRNALYMWIDFCKQFLHAYKSTSRLDFSTLRKTQDYESLDDFYKDLDKHNYMISWTLVDEEKVRALVEDGSLFLFQIYNKDFAEGASGTPNLHTIYWKGIFSPENMKHVVFKLNGDAELFWRPQGIKEPFVHRMGEKLVNRRTVDGAPIPDKIFGELFRYVNGKRSEPLSGEAQQLMDSGKLVVKDVKHPITKDRRFTQHKFLFHVPMTFNYGAPGKISKFNDLVNERLRGNPDVNIIGIDRGERNLIYVTLINQQGKILLQKSFNAIEEKTHEGKVQKTNYQAKLDLRERERQDARHNWDTIGQIKELKAGYLSQVVHEIAELMVRYNAIIVLEDLNFGFKRGRFAIEKQVYQKFEKALIDKLNYLVFKNRPTDEAGGAFKGYQLTAPFESFEKMGKQSGFLFYVPAGYTSKIDPTTGFTNLFNTKKCTNAENRKAFFSAFESIRYDAERKAFAFAFNYKIFKTGQTSWRNEWTVYSAEKRLVFDKLSKSTKEINPTAIISAALKDLGHEVTNDLDVLSLVRSTETKGNERFFGDLFYAFERTLQMRNSLPHSSVDYIESPVLNATGTFFRSSEDNQEWPVDADANGAYHIALKGLYLLEELGKNEKFKGVIEHAKWFEFVQKRNQK